MNSHQTRFTTHRDFDSDDEIIPNPHCNPRLNKLLTLPPDFDKHQKGKSLIDRAVAIAEREKKYKTFQNKKSEKNIMSEPETTMPGSCVSTNTEDKCTICGHLPCQCQDAYDQEFQLLKSEAEALRRQQECNNPTPPGDEFPESGDEKSQEGNNPPVEIDLEDYDDTQRAILLLSEGINQVKEAIKLNFFELMKEIDDLKSSVATNKFFLDDIAKSLGEVQNIISPISTVVSPVITEIDQKTDDIKSHLKLIGTEVKNMREDIGVCISTRDKNSESNKQDSKSHDKVEDYSSDFDTLYSQHLATCLLTKSQIYQIFCARDENTMMKVIKGFGVTINEEECQKLISKIDRKHYPLILLQLNNISTKAKLAKEDYSDSSKPSTSKGPQPSKTTRSNIGKTRIRLSQFKD